MIRSERLRDAAIAGGIAAAASIAYLAAFRAGFVWDDHDLILESTLLRGPLSRIWFSADATDYWPLTWTTFWVEARAFGLAAAPFHAVNVALHVVASLLLWRLLRALRIPGAAVAGLLFAVHPVAVESVAWISERKNVLSAVFFFASLVAWARYDDGGRRRDGMASFLLYVLSLLAKTSVVMLPFVQLGISLWRRGTITRRDLARTAPFFVLSAAFAAVTIRFQGAHVVRGEIAERGIAERIGGAGWALVSYAQKAFVPIDLALVYPRWPIEPGTAGFWIPLVAVLVAAVAAWWFSRRSSGRPIAFALGYHALMVLPVLGLLDMAYLAVGPVSNHLQYLALAAPCALAGAGLAVLHRRLPRVAVAVGAVASMALGVYTHRRAEAFESDLRLWESASRDSPRSLYASMSLAQERGATVSVAAAVAELQAFAERTPDEADRRLARAHAFVYLRRPADAASEAMAAERLRPDVQRQIEIGRFLVTSGFLEDAIRVLAAQAGRSPRSADVRYWLGAALWRAGRPGEAREAVLDGLRVSPGDPKLRRALALFDAPGQAAPRPREARP